MRDEIRRKDGKIGGWIERLNADRRMRVIGRESKSKSERNEGAQQESNGAPLYPAGITGIDVIEETVPPEEVVREVDLGFGRCKLGVLAPVASVYKDPKQLAGKRIVTSFPNCTPSSSFSFYPSSLSLPSLSSFSLLLLLVHTLQHIKVSKTKPNLSTCSGRKVFLVVTLKPEA